MTLDRFEPRDRDAFVAFAPAAAGRFYGAVDWLAKRLSVEIEGVERIPPGRALLVANHAFGFDIAFAIAAVRRATGRTVWVLGEHAWWKVPFVRREASAIGIVDGTRENVDLLLERGELVVVLPGGLREAVKPHILRYRLLWGHRYGFVRAAIRAGAPILPLASIGADDVFHLVGDAFGRGSRWFGRRDIPIPMPLHLLPLPHLSPLRFVVGEPIDPPPSPAAADDPKAVRRLRREIEGALHEIIEEELARRAGIDLGSP